MSHPIGDALGAAAAFWAKAVLAIIVGLVGVGGVLAWSYAQTGRRDDAFIACGARDVPLNSDNTEAVCPDGRRLRWNDTRDRWEP